MLWQQTPPSFQRDTPEKAGFSLSKGGLNAHSPSVAQAGGTAVSWNAAGCQGRRKNKMLEGFSQQLNGVNRPDLAQETREPHASARDPRCTLASRRGEPVS